VRLDAKALLAILIVFGTFVILGIYVYQGRAPEAVVAAILSGSLSGVVAFYFGHQNGSTSALATAATQLAAQAIEKRQPPLVLPVTLTAAPAPPAPPGTVSPAS
jgi:hypothetical protein